MDTLIKNNIIDLELDPRTQEWKVPGQAEKDWQEIINTPEAIQLEKELIEMNDRYIQIREQIERDKNMRALSNL